MRSMENWQTPVFNGRLHRHFMTWEEANRVVMKLDMLNWLSTACPGKAEAGICETAWTQTRTPGLMFSVNQTDSMGLVLCSVPSYIALHTSGMCNGEDQIQQLVTGRGLLVFSCSLWIWQDKILLKVYSLHLCARSFSKALCHLSPLAIKVCRQSSE